MNCKYVQSPLYVLQPYQVCAPEYDLTWGSGSGGTVSEVWP